MARPIGDVRGEIKLCPACNQPTGEFLITMNGAHQYHCTECHHGWSQTLDVTSRFAEDFAEMYGEDF